MLFKTQWQRIHDWQTMSPKIILCLALVLSGANMQRIFFTIAFFLNIAPFAFGLSAAPPHTPVGLDQLPPAPVYSRAYPVYTDVFLNNLDQRTNWKKKWQEELPKSGSGLRYYSGTDSGAIQTALYKVLTDAGVKTQRNHVFFNDRLGMVFFQGTQSECDLAQLVVNDLNGGMIFKANPSIRHAVSIRVPTKLKIGRTADMLTLEIDENSFVPARLSVGTNMWTGFDRHVFVYPFGGKRPVNQSDLADDNGNSVNVDSDIFTVCNGMKIGNEYFSFGKQNFDVKEDGLSLPGRKYIVEMDSAIFELEPDWQDYSNPQRSKTYKILWRQTLKQTVE
jgi:hypothetical protein